MASGIPPKRKGEKAPETDAQPTYRMSMLPFGTYGNPDGTESLGMAVPGMIYEPFEALKRLAANSVDENGNIAIPNPENPQNRQDVLTGLLSLYGGNALNPAAAIPKGGLASGIMRDAAEHPGFDVWHGSPHDFDKFDASKIGTGEGAQAYGHGLYFAESPDVAKGYQKTLASDYAVPAQRLLDKHGGDVDAAMAASQAEIDRLKSLNLTPETGSVARDRKIADQQDRIGTLSQYKATGQMPQGYLYQSRVNANPEDFLHLDKKFGEQSPIVQDALTSLLAERQPDLKIHPEYPVSGLMNVARMQPAEIAVALKDAGIPGIRYLDAGSRGSREGSHNVVMFSDEPVNVIHKWRGDQQLYSDTGLPSLPGALAAGQDTSIPNTNGDGTMILPPQVGMLSGVPGTTLANPAPNTPQMALPAGLLSGMDMSGAAPQTPPAATPAPAAGNPIMQGLVQGDKDAMAIMPKMADFQFQAPQRAPIDLSRLAAIAQARQNLGVRA